MLVSYCVRVVGRGNKNFGLVHFRKIRFIFIMSDIKLDFFISYVNSSDISLSCVFDSPWNLFGWCLVT